MRAISASTDRRAATVSSTSKRSSRSSTTASHSRRGAQDRIQRRDRLQAVVAAARDRPQRLARLGVRRRSAPGSPGSARCRLDVGQLGLDQLGRAEARARRAPRGVALARHAQVEHLEQVGVAPLAREHASSASSASRSLALSSRIARSWLTASFDSPSLSSYRLRGLQAQRAPVADALGDLDLALEDLRQLAPRSARRGRAAASASSASTSPSSMPSTSCQARIARSRLLERQLVEHGDALGDQLAVGGIGARSPGASPAPRPARPCAPPRSAAARAPGTSRDRRAAPPAPRARPRWPGWRRRGAPR